MLDFHILNKKIFLFLFVFTTNLFACDICSCGATNAGGIHSDFMKNYLGFKYVYANFSYKEGIFSNAPIAHDYINALQLQGQYFVKNKLTVNFNIPFQKNIRENSSGISSINGLGDISFFAFYNLLKTHNNHIVKIGSGIKLPTGKYSLNNGNTNQTSATQLGTGSYDYFLPIQYSYTNNSFGLKCNATHYFKGRNADQFKFGNQTQLSTKINVKVFQKSNTEFHATTLVNYDTFKENEYYDIVDYDTNGFILNGGVGLELHNNMFTLGIVYNHPIEQNILNSTMKFDNGLGIATYYRF